MSQNCSSITATAPRGTPAARYGSKKPSSAILKKARDCELPAGVLTDNVDDVINNREIKVVAQLIGGLEPERTIMLQLLESGKDVVTANKALLAEHGPELFDRARELGRSIAFEASVAGGIPIIANISQCLSANQIVSLDGILNGTTQFHPQQNARGRHGLRRRRSKKPSDSATRKPIPRSTSTAATPPRSSPSSPTWRSAPASIGKTFRGWASTGSTTATSASPRKWATASSCSPSPSSTATRSNCTSRQRSSSAAGRSPMSAAPFNAIRVVGDAVGELMFYGRGAGQMPTASAVVADMIDTAVGRTAITFRTLELWSKRKARVSPRELRQSRGRFYMRMNVVRSARRARPGRRHSRPHHISIASRLAAGSREGSDTVPLVIMTHETTEGCRQQGVRRINKLECVRGQTVRMWVRDKQLRIRNADFGLFSIRIPQFASNPKS